MCDSDHSFYLRSRARQRQRAAGFGEGVSVGPGRRRYFGFWRGGEEGGVHFMATVLSLSGRETFTGLAPGFDFVSTGLGTRISRPHLGHATRRPAPADRKS